MTVDTVLFSRFSVFAALLIGSAVVAPVAQARYSALVVEADSGEVLYEQSAYELRHPASLTKMMTLYMVFDALSRGRLKSSQPLWVSSYAASRPPTKLGLQAGDSITVQEAIYGLITKSANDAATVIAEALGGSELDFAQQMTRQARLLGMNNTYFRNASGLPDPYQITTAWDMYKLAKALQRDFPQYYRYFAVTDFSFRNSVHRNHNKLLFDYQGTDGIKTGYTRDSGYNLVASVHRQGHRVIGVVFGGSSASARDAHMRAILDQGFARLAGGPWQAVEPPPSFRVAELDVMAEPTETGRRSTLDRRTKVAKPMRSENSSKQLRIGKQTAKSKARTGATVAKAASSKSAKSLKLAKTSSPKSVKSAKLMNSTTPAKRSKASKSAAATKSVKSAKPASANKSVKHANVRKSVGYSRNGLLSKAN
jgi:D-alanyl-D-alanine carboxypeptidase